MLFALPAGALVDRWDRRRVLWLTDAYRGLVIATLTVARPGRVGEHPSAWGGGLSACRRRHAVLPDPLDPFLADAVSFAVSAALLAPIPGRYTPAAEHGHDEDQAQLVANRPRLRGEIVEGLRWLAGHRLLRTLA